LRFYSLDRNWQWTLSPAEHGLREKERRRVKAGERKDRRRGMRLEAKKKRQGFPHSALARRGAALLLIGKKK
jgi:hypothetical protein